MKTLYNFRNGSWIEQSTYSLAILTLLISALLISGAQNQLSAQKQEIEYTKPAWWFGAAGAANFNFYRGTTQQLTTDFMAPTAFRHGTGVGLFAVPLIEYHRPGTMLGGMLQGGFDSRKGVWDQVMTPCDCPADLSTNLSYWTIEPSLKFAPFKSSLHIFAGPRFAFARTQAFTYTQDINPLFPEQPIVPDLEGDFSDTKSNLISYQVGAGIDIPLSKDEKQNQWILAPFVAYHPYFSQHPRTSETWNITTIRVGAALKFGRGKVEVKQVSEPTPIAKVVIAPLPKVVFSVNSPENIPLERKVRETFPLRNYIYFDANSTHIPTRYVNLKKSEVKEFSEDQLEVFTPKSLAGRANRGMLVYYNVLNILGDRMNKNPSASIVLVGSSEKGTADGKMMSESIKKYLIEVFSISESRIKTEGRLAPKEPSKQLGGVLELDLLKAEDRRVTVESSSPLLLMEFETGTAPYLKPVILDGIEQAPIESYVLIHAKDAHKALDSWRLEVINERGVIQKFGPFYEYYVSLSGKSILGSNIKGSYTFKMIGKTKYNQEIREEAKVNMVLWTPPVDEIGMRYSVIYEFDETKSSVMNEKYIREIIVPKIPTNATLIIHGYTDTIGDKENNRLISLARANDVKNIIEKELSRKGIKGVKKTVHGFGEEQGDSPYNNKLPESRAYNRSVVIDIIPSSKQN